jgi:hypothetical protein
LTRQPRLRPCDPLRTFSEVPSCSTGLGSERPVRGRGEPDPAQQSGVEGHDDRRQAHEHGTDRWGERDAGPGERAGAQRIGNDVAAGRPYQVVDILRWLARGNHTTPAALRGLLEARMTPPTRSSRRSRTVGTELARRRPGSQRPRLTRWCLAAERLITAVIANVAAAIDDMVRHGAAALRAYVSEPEIEQCGAEFRNERPEVWQRAIVLGPCPLCRTRASADR